MSDCIFCKIIKKETPSKIVYEDTNVFAFRDINPQAKTHILVVPKKHLSSIDELGPADQTLNDIFTAVRKIAKQEKIDASGYRVVINKGPDSGQAVSHLHIHILGGKRLSDSMA